jgi:hypothetical protein
MRAPGIWILMLLATIVAAFVVAVVPLLGWLAVSLLGPVVGGSLMLAARKVDGGGTLDFSDLAMGFRNRFTPLLILGAVYVGVAFAIGLVAGIAGVGFGLGALGAAGSNSGAGLAALLGMGALFFLVIFVIAIAIGMAFWYAPALQCHRRDPPEFQRLSEEHRRADCVRDPVPGRRDRRQYSVRPRLDRADPGAGADDVHVVQGRVWRLNRVPAARALPDRFNQRTRFLRAETRADREPSVRSPHTRSSRHAVITHQSRTCATARAAFASDSVLVLSPKLATSE